MAELSPTSTSIQTIYGWFRESKLDTRKNLPVIAAF